MASKETPGYFEVIITSPRMPGKLRCLIRGTSWPAARARAIRHHGGDAVVTRVTRQERTLAGVPIKRYGQIKAAVS